MNDGEVDFQDLNESSYEFDGDGVFYENGNTKDMSSSSGISSDEDSISLVVENDYEERNNGQLDNETISMLSDAQHVDDDGGDGDIERNNHSKEDYEQEKRTYSKSTHENKGHYSSFLVETAPTSKNATKLLLDIMNITHIPQNQTIIIYFKDPGITSSSSSYQRQCYNPIVRGRLSGSSLSIIDFQEYKKPYKKEMIIPTIDDRIDNENEGERITHYTEALIGMYDVPLAGMYYIEIIGILCNHNFDVPDHNFKNTCLINPLDHRLTAMNASINVTNIADVTTTHSKNGSNDKQGKGDTSIIGHWKHSPASPTSNNDEHGGHSLVPLYTRYQPLNCRSDENKEFSRCMNASDTTRFHPYQFEYNHDVKAELQSILQTFNSNTEKVNRTLSDSVSSMTKEATVCVIGWSHTRHLIDSLRKTIKIAKGISLNIEILWVKARFPNELHDISFFRDIQNKYPDDKNCTHIIVGLGQWPANKPMLLDEYKQDMQKAVDVMKQAEEEMKFKFFLRSIQ